MTCALSSGDRPSKVNGAITFKRDVRERHDGEEYRPLGCLVRRVERWYRLIRNTREQESTVDTTMKNDGDHDLRRGCEGK